MVDTNKYENYNGFIVAKESENAVMVKKKYKDVYDENHLGIYTTTVWIPKKCCVIENGNVYVVKWFKSKLQPKTFTFKIPNQTDSCIHDFAEPVNGYSDSFTVCCRKCGYEHYDE